jgi:hypothetical protein
VNRVPRRMYYPSAAPVRFSNIVLDAKALFDQIRPKLLESDVRCDRIVGTRSASTGPPKACRTLEVRRRMCRRADLRGSRPSRRWPVRQASIN